MSRVAVIGVGLTQFGEIWAKSMRKLLVEAGLKAVEDAGIQRDQIDATYIGNMSGGLFVSQEHTASILMDHMGLTPKPATRVEAACASGSLALRNAYLAIKSGEHDVVVASGVEKMTDVLTQTTTGALSTASDQEWEAFFGATFPSIYALMARRHMHEYKTTEQQMAMVSVKNHHNGTLNPYAQFQKEITIDQVMNSTKVADPLKLLDCSPITDGAAVVILASEEVAKEVCKNPVWITGTGHATGPISLHDRKTLTSIPASVVAANKAFEQANRKPTDINLAEVHDCFTIAELIALEDLGFCEPGQAAKLTENGETALNGSIPINTSGGLKACGHPVGATGIKQAVEIVTQLRGKAEKRQIKGANIGLTHNVGGSGGTSIVHIFENG